MNLKYKLGDSVIVKQGIKEPDLGNFEIGGWQGRIIEMNSKSRKDNTLITIEWDSLTLGQIPSDYIEQSERDGYDWQSMTLYESDLEKAIPRDKKRNVKKIQDKLSEEHYWASHGDEGIRISKVLDKVDPNDEMACLEAWVEYLDKELTFPVHAIVTDSEDNRLIEPGNKVLIKSLPHIVDMYGIIASIRLNGRKFQFPLCDVEVIDKSKPDFQLINDYRIWFANR